jgi:hypothetical protein
LKNYSEEQITNDIQKQLEIAKSREKLAAKEASDYSKDPSRIKVRDKDGKAVVSKFRQI